MQRIEATPLSLVQEAAARRRKGSRGGDRVRVRLRRGCSWAAGWATEMIGPTLLLGSLSLCYFSFCLIKENREMTEKERVVRSEV